MTRSCIHHESYLPTGATVCQVHGTVAVGGCSGCGEFVLRPVTRPQKAVTPRPVAWPQCVHLGSKRRCCDSLHICRKLQVDCIPLGTAEAPVVSCEFCEHYLPNQEA